MTSAYQQQLVQQLRAAEDELRQWRQRASREAEYRERAERAEAELALLHESEEPYDDERLVPTPAQWIWKWNQATPAERLERAEQVIADRDRVTRCTLAHSALFARAEQAEARIAAVRELATKAVASGSSWDGNEPALGQEILDALDATAEARP